MSILFKGCSSARDLFWSNAKAISNERALLAIAILKFLRGTVAIAIAIGFGSLARHSQMQTFVAPRWQSWIDADPLLQLIANWLITVSGDTLFLLGLMFFGLGMVRYLEGWCIWSDKAWGRWLAVLRGLAYIPMEMYFLQEHFRWPIAILLAVNVLVVLYLFSHLRTKR